MFDIEEFKKELAKMSYAERYQAYEDQIDELETMRDEIDEAISDICAIRDQDMSRHDAEVWQTIAQSIRELITQKQLPQEKIKIDDKNNTFAITTTSGIVNVTTQPVDAPLWYIAIEPEFIISDTKRHEAYANLAERLALPYQQGEDYLNVHVEENELQAIVERIVTTLCE